MSAHPLNVAQTVAFGLLLAWLGSCALGVSFGDALWFVVATKFLVRPLVEASP